LIKKLLALFLVPLLAFADEGQDAVRVGKVSRRTLDKVDFGIGQFSYNGVVYPIGNAANSIPVLDGNGKLLLSIFPSSALSPVTSVAGRTGAVTLQSGDITGALGFTPYNSSNPSNFITAGGAPVQSVAGRAGAVTLTTSDVAEASGLYFTNPRAIAAPLTGFSAGAGVVSATDSVLSAVQKHDAAITSNTAAVNANGTAIATETSRATGAEGTLTTNVASNTSSISTNATTMNSHISNTSNPHAVTKSQVGLGNADNTSDVNKPVSTAQAASIATKEATANKGAASGYAPLDSGSKLPAANLPAEAARIDTAQTFTQTQTFPVHDNGGQVFNVAAFSGADLGAKIQAAHDAMPSTGGIIEAGVPSLAGAQTLSAITLTKPTRLKFGQQTLTATGTITIASGARSVIIEGIGASQTASTKITTPNGAPLITFSGYSGTNINYLEIDRIKFSAGTGNSYIVYDGTVGTGLGFNESHFVFTDNTVSGFATSHAIYVGDSFYYNHITRNHFYNNTYSIRTGRNSDAIIDKNNGTSFGQITTLGSSARIMDNGFAPMSQTTPDILIDSAANGGDGYLWIARNKFGPEGETSTRKKIVIQSSTSATYLVPDVNIIDNNFESAISPFGQTAIEIDNPVRQINVRGNYFDGFQYVINDNQASGAAGSSGGIFEGNTITTIASGAESGSYCTPFANGGRGFDRISFVSPTSQEGVNAEPRSNETLYLVNRLLYSDAFDNAAWVKSSGVTTTTGQADPFGGTSAQKITRSGSATFQSIRAVVTTAAIGSVGVIGSKVVVTFWAKAGSAGAADIGLQDTTDSLFPFFQRVTLATGWKKYKFTVSGINPAHAFTLFFYPVQSNVAVAGDMYLSRCQVSDSDTDFLPTSGASASDLTAGNRYERTVIHNTATASTVAGFDASKRLVSKTAGTDYLSPSDIVSFSTFGSSAGAVMATNGPLATGASNTALAAIVRPPRNLAVTKLQWVSGATVSGNYDIGIYDSGGTRLWSLGATAFPAASTPTTVTVSPTLNLTAGTDYYVLWVCDSATATIRGNTSTNSNQGVRLDGKQFAALYASAANFPTSGLLGSVTLTTSGNAKLPLIEFRTD
jgi:hypothetical protein